MADCMQFLLENRLNKCKFLDGSFFLKSESNFGFLHVSTQYTIISTNCSQTLLTFIPVYLYTKSNKVSK